MSNLKRRWKRSITIPLKRAEECIKVAVGLESQNHTRSRKGLPKPSPSIVALGYVAASPPAAEQLHCLALGDESRASTIA